MNILESRQSEFYKHRLQLYMLRVDVELVRFGILVNNTDLHRFVCVSGMYADEIRSTLMKLKLMLKKLSRDFPPQVRDDIVSGRFTERLLAYKTR